MIGHTEVPDNELAALRSRIAELEEALEAIHENLLNTYRGTQPWPPGVGVAISLAEGVISNLIRYGTPTQADMGTTAERRDE